MTRVAALLCLGAISAYEVTDQVFQSKRKAHVGFIRVRRENLGVFFEERLQKASFERECIEEQCDKEEYLETTVDSVANGDMTTDEVEAGWTKLVKHCYVPRKIEADGVELSGAYCNANGTAVCIQTWNNARCACKKGYTGTHCDDDINECEEPEYDVCRGEEENSYCSNKIGGYECLCKSGYAKTINLEVKYNYTCEDIDECSLGTDNCDRDLENCVNTPGAFTCELKPIVCEGIMWEGQCIEPCEGGKEFDEGSGACACPDGEVFDGEQCVLVTTMPTTTIVTCPIGEVLIDGICKPKTTTIQPPTTTHVYQCTKDPCSYNNGKGGCEQHCHSNYAKDGSCDYWCSCDAGMKLSCDGKTCMMRLLEENDIESGST